MGENATSKLLKKRWKSEGKEMSLREFVSTLVEQNEPLAKKWLTNKKGACNQKRSEKNEARIALQRQATKSAKTKKKG